MASNKVDWILFVSALVSCVLITTVAGDGESIRALESSLRTTLITGAKIETTLLEYEPKEDKILDYSVKELAELCEETTSNCAYREYERALGIMKYYQEQGINQLAGYVSHCQYAKLYSYCAYRIDEVGKNLLSETVAEGAQELLRSFLQILKEAGVLDNISSAFSKRDPKMGEKQESLDADLVKAFFELGREKYGSTDMSLDENKELLSNLDEALSSFEELGKTCEYYSRFRPDVGPDPNGDILIFEGANLHKVALRYAASVSLSLKEQIEKTN